MYESLEKVLDPTAEFIYKQIPGKGWIFSEAIRDLLIKKEKCTKSSSVQKGKFESKKDIGKQNYMDPPECDVVDSVVADGSNDKASLGGEH